eukprot:TRINITY_DN933_c1_g1_i1.p3 TRINITY_DN933_c1_g1~~TRINITY_DN933_c1_g1_i1.p3  ORF type:complete len:154 (-),score=2.41 TRINITY_DN933_c1_g1_i1:346-807(-)
MSVIISRRSRLLILIHRSEVRFVASGEESGSDYLLVAAGGAEGLALLTFPSPGGGHGSETGIVEALALGPDARVQDPDHDLAFRVGLGQQPVRAVQTQELGRSGRVELVSDLRKDGYDSVSRFEGCCFFLREAGGEAVDDGVVGVDYFGRVGH